MNMRGFTLIEMLIVLAIVVLILSVALPQYGLMMQRRNMEKEMREIKLAITAFRLSAMHQKEQRRILIGPNLLHFQRFNTIAAGWQPALGAPPLADTDVPPDMILAYGIQRLTGGALAQFNINNDMIVFDERGNAAPFNLATIVVTPVEDVSDGCIVVDVVRDSLGRMINANTCQVH